MNFDEELNKSLSLIKEGHLNKAEIILRNIVKKQPNNSSALTLLGIALIHKKEFIEGICLIENSLLINKNQPQALVNCSIGFLEIDKPNEAINYLNSAIKLNSNYAEAFYFLGKSYRKINKNHQAINSYEKALKINQGYLEAILDLGYLYFDLNQLELALNFLEQALLISGEKVDLLIDIGHIKNELGNYEGAINDFDHAIKINSNAFRAFNNKGITYIKMDKLDDALFNLNMAITLAPNYLDALNNRSIVLITLNKFSEAETDCKKVLKLDPEFSNSFNNLGRISIALGKYDSASNYFQRAIDLQPNNADYILDLANLLHVQKKFNLAKILYQKAIKINPDDKHVLYDASLFFLSIKEFLIGWNYYEARFYEPGYESSLDYLNKIGLNYPLWNGQLDCKSLLVIGEQGIGDHIFYSSMLSELTFKVKKITVLINTKLIRLLARSFKNINFISLDSNYINKEKLDIFNIDYYISLGSIGNILIKANTNFLENRVKSYLKTEQTYKLPLNVIKNRLICGISWKSQNPKLGSKKSVDLKILMPILELSGLTFINLQYGDVAEEVFDFIDATNIDINLIEDIDKYNNIDELASLIEACDFVVTTSNVTAHIAGAIGKKTFLLIPYFGGKIWYWHENDKISLWYPSINIFRQKVFGDWTSTINEMKSDISNYIQELTQK